MVNIVDRLKFVSGLLLVVCCLLILSPVIASAGVEATGMAAITVSKSQAREDALNDAKRNAVEQTLGSMLTSETLVENYVLVKDKILTRVQGYVKNYTIISEKFSGDECTIVIRAEVEEMALADDVAALAGLLPRMNYPTLAISIKEQSLNAQSGQLNIDLSAARQALSQALQSKGFNLVDLDALQRQSRRQAGLAAAQGNAMKQAQEAASYQAQLLITGSAVVQDNGASPYNQRLHAYGATITANIHESATGRILATANAQASVPQYSFALGSQKALSQAATKLGDDLSDQVVKVWLDACYNEHKVMVIVEDAGFGEVQKVVRAVAALRGVSTASQRAFVRGRAELQVGWHNCNVVRLAEVLSGLSVGSKKLEVIEVDGNSVRTQLK